jgi:hypothetical protein
MGSQAELEQLQNLGTAANGKGKKEDPKVTVVPKGKDKKAAEEKAKAKPVAIKAM